ncbi:MAG: DUF4129 domain-containing protein [Verrucomicrobia bacterium]|nr:DUF4129 domain-containing protein [Verrucomicrobiota bacterium]
MSARPAKRLAGLPAFELVEEAVQLLRLAPPRILVTYYAGAVPFVLALLYFWADMSRGAQADGRCASGALLLALLFIWMKTCQSRYALRLRSRLTGAETPRWGAGELMRVAAEHAALHAPLLFFAPLLPVALVAPEAFGFLQTLTVLADGQPRGLRAAIRRAAHQTSLWSMQQRVLQIVLALFGLIVLVNVIFAMQLGPLLLKMFLGVETTFTRGGMAMILNTTYFASAVALAWLCVDPLLKAVYVLRCFYGESLATGEDLRVEIRRARQAPGWLGAALAVVLAVIAAAAEPPAGGARTPTSAAAPASVPAADLSEAIERTLAQREFAWRMPRELGESVAKGWLRQFTEDTAEAIKRTVTTVVKFLKKVYDKLREFAERWFKVKDSSDESGSVDWQSGVRLLVFILLAVVAAVLGVLLFRLWRQRQKRTVVLAQAVAATPDLTDENTTADQLPEDDWLKLARELAGRGELRLAIRALYLASLAHLGRRELVVIARFKSNRDYELELRRRARAWPVLQGAFAENVGSFDRAWYGMHEVSSDALQQFEANLQRIRATGGPTQ